jgi:hypothetical protein
MKLTLVAGHPSTEVEVCRDKECPFDNPHLHWNPRSRGNRGKTPLIREMDRFIETNLRAAASELGRDVTTLRVLLWEESERPAKGGK